MKLNLRIGAMGAVAAIVFGVPGCGGGSAETTKSPPESAPKSSPDSSPTKVLEVTIDGQFGPATAGMVMAKELGYFDDVGIEVILYNPSNPRRPVRYVNERVVDLSITHEPEVVLAREQGVPLVAIGSLISRPTAAMIWPKNSGIRSLTDLRGKTISIPGVQFQRLFLKNILARVGLTLDDVKLKVVGFGLVHALVSGKADAIFGGSSNIEGAELEKQGLKPIVKRVQGLGVPAYDELVVIARRDRLSRDPRVIRNFMAAVHRGTAAAIDHPRAAAKALVEIAKELEGDTRSVKLMEVEMKRSLPLLSRTGEIDPKKMSGLVSWMHEQGMIDKEPSASDLFSNDYLPPPEP